MLEQDYLMRILLQFAEAIRRSWSRAVEDRDPRDAANMLERAVGDATDIDGATLLSLSPESIASVMQVSGVDPRVSEYIARSLLLASGCLSCAPGCSAGSVIWRPCAWAAGCASSRRRRA